MTHFCDIPTISCRHCGAILIILWDGPQVSPGEYAEKVILHEEACVAGTDAAEAQG